jgi:hypothetical protein
VMVFTHGDDKNWLVSNHRIIKMSNLRPTSRRRQSLAFQHRVAAGRSEVVLTDGGVVSWAAAPRVVFKDPGRLNVREGERIQ